MTIDALTRTPSGIACWSMGEGPVLITVHGGPGMDHRFFRPTLDALATRRRIIYFDLPGHGTSDVPADYELHTMAMAIDDVRQHLGAEQISLLGSSYGGFLSLIYAREHPKAVRSLVLVDTSASYGFRKESLRVAQRRGTPAILAALDRLWDGSLTTDDDFHTAWRDVFPLYFHRTPAEEVYRIADTSSYRLETRKQVLPTLRDYDVRAELGMIHVPTLVIAGRHDWITSVSQAEELAAGLPVSDLVIYEGSGHYPFIDEPQAFMPTVDEWLRAHGA